MPLWKKGVDHVEPKKRHQIQEALPIVRGRLSVVEVMPTHCTKRRFPIATKLNVEVTQHHHLVNMVHDLQIAK